MAEKSKDYYSLLGIKPNASKEELHVAYRKKLRAYHPDLNKSDCAEKIYMEILEAYNILSDPRKRKLYDMQRRNYMEPERSTPPRATTPPSPPPSSRSGNQDMMYGPAHSSYSSAYKPSYPTKKPPEKKKGLLGKLFSAFGGSSDK